MEVDGLIIQEKPRHKSWENNDKHFSEHLKTVLSIRRLMHAIKFKTNKSDETGRTIMHKVLNVQKHLLNIVSKYLKNH